jgi:hypothetical protein
MFFLASPTRRHRPASGRPHGDKVSATRNQATTASPTSTSKPATARKHDSHQQVHDSIPMDLTPYRSLLAEIFRAGAKMKRSTTPFGLRFGLLFDFRMRCFKSEQ